MSKSLLKKLMKSAPVKVLRRTALLLGLGLCALCGLLLLAWLALPPLASSDFGRGLVTGALTSALGRPAALESLAFSWSEGVRVRSLRVGQGEMASPGFLASVEEARLDIGYAGLLRGDLRLDMAVRGLRLRLPHTPKEPDPPLHETLRKAFAALRTGVEPLDADVDAHLRLELSDAALFLEPAPGGAPLELRLAQALVESQGLGQGPLRMTAALALSGASASSRANPVPVRLEARLTGLKAPDGRIVPAQARLDARLDAPGTELLVQGGLDAGLTASLRADARKTLDALAPLSADPLPQIDGALALSASLKRNGAQSASLGLALFADALKLGGLPLGGKALGPLSLNLLQEAELDLSAQSAAMPGSLELRPGAGGAARLGWTATLGGLDVGRLRLGLDLNDIRLELTPLLPALRQALPAGVSLSRAEAGLDSLSLAAEFPQAGGRPDLSLGLRALAVRIDGLALALPGGRAGMRQARLLLREASAHLPAVGKGSARAELSAEADSLRLDRAKPVAVNALRLTQLTLRLDEAALDPAALHGLSGQAALGLAARLQGLQATGTASAPTLDLELSASARLPAQKSASVALHTLKAQAPGLRITHGGAATHAPLELRASAQEILLGRGDLPGLKAADCLLELGRALRLEAKADLAARNLRSTGSLRLDAGKTLALAHALAPAGLKASGTAEAAWTLDAELPLQAAADTPQQPGFLRRTLKELDALRALQATLTLDGLGLDLPMDPGDGSAAEVLRLRGLSTPRPLRLSARQGLREARLEGSLAFGPLDSAPGIGRLARPVRGLLTVNAAQQGARSAQLSQMLRLDGLDLEQSLTLSVDKLDAVLDREDILPAILERLDAGASFRLSTSLAALPPGARAKGLGGAGRLEAQASGRLTGGRSLAVSAKVLSPGLELSLGPDLALEGLSSTLRLGRRYRLSPGLACPGDARAEAAPLSEQVFDLYPNQPGGRQAHTDTPLGQLLSQDDSGEGGTVGGTLSAARIRIKGGPLALDLRDLEARLDDSGPLPGLKSFRCGLLGGDILGSALVRKAAGRYTLDADLGFTGIDAARLLPDTAARDLDDQAQASGRVSLSLPITADPEELLRRLALRADITRIGPRTLERLLYALDPDELNEAIVQQRRLMGMGHPRHLRVAAAYGNLSVTGAVEVKGFRLDLPPVDRLPIANLPLRGQLAKPLAVVPGLIKLLDAASGSQICRDPASPGALRVVEPASQGGRP